MKAVTYHGTGDFRFDNVPDPRMRMSCREGVTVSIDGVYAGLVDEFHIGAAFGKALSFRRDRTHALRHAPEPLGRIERGEIDPSSPITRRESPEAAPELYEAFREEKDGRIKVVMRS